VETRDVVIIGAGPAGLSSALQLKRYGIDCALLERSEVGGLLRNANLVENYPGFPQGITGPELIRRMVEQLQSTAVQVTQAEVTAVSYQERSFHVTTTTGQHQARVLVIATGTKPKVFKEIPIPESLRSQVYFEVYPLLGVSGKQIAILGAGDAAFDYAINLSKQNRAVILNHSSRISCLPLLWQRACASPQIAYHPNTRLLRLEELPARQISLECTNPVGNVGFEVDYLIAALGREPQLDFLPQTWAEDSAFLEKQGVLYSIGDVKNGIYRQTAIAVGDGLLAAMKIYRYLKETTQ
jgi:thioredoxin reductase (NADPH)